MLPSNEIWSSKSASRLCVQDCEGKFNIVHMDANKWETPVQPRPKNMLACNVRPVSTAGVSRQWIKWWYIAQVPRSDRQIWASSENGKRLPGHNRKNFQVGAVYQAQPHYSAKKASSPSFWGLSAVEMIRERRLGGSMLITRVHTPCTILMNFDLTCAGLLNDIRSLVYCLPANAIGKGVLSSVQRIIRLF